MIFHRKNIFEYLKEADDNTDSDTASTETNNDSGEDTNSSPDNTEQQNSNDDESKDDTIEEPEDNGDDENFDIDATLDEDDMDKDNASDNTDTNVSDNSDSSSSQEGSEEEPVKANTDIFSSLTAEEQQIKISELKSLFGDLFASCNELMEKINNIDRDTVPEDIVARLSMSMYSLRKYIGDYITTTFSQKSYIENDIALNRFLSIFNSITSIAIEIGVINDKKVKKSDKK